LINSLNQVDYINEDILAQSFNILGNIY